MKKYEPPKIREVKELDVEAVADTSGFE